MLLCACAPHVTAVLIIMHWLVTVLARRSAANWINTVVAWQRCAVCLLISSNNISLTINITLKVIITIIMMIMTGFIVSKIYAYVTKSCQHRQLAMETFCPLTELPATLSRLQTLLTYAVR